MQYHNHVTLNWPRCSSVEERGEYLACALDWGRKYSLLDNRAQLHVRFLNVKTDEDLLQFVRAWGPLWLARPGEEDSEGQHGNWPRSWYWAFQSKLTAETGLFQSLKCGDKASLKDALLEYVAAKDGFSNTTIPFYKSTFTASTLSQLFAGNPDAKPEEWIPAVDIPCLREAAAWCIGTFHCDFALRPTWEQTKLQLKWKPFILSLGDAIELELWNSFASARPVTICEECGTAFQPESAHQRKFCSYTCAHRVAMRMWRKNPKRKRGKHAKAKKA
jgi:hypothetical protein